MQVKNSLALLVLLSGCVSNEVVKTPDGMKVSLESAVKDCEFKGDVRGVSSLYGYFVETGLARARAQSFQQAKDLGANTIVWQPFQTQVGSH